MKFKFNIHYRYTVWRISKEVDFDDNEKIEKEEMKQDTVFSYSVEASSLDLAHGLALGFANHDGKRYLERKCSLAGQPLTDELVEIFVQLEEVEDEPICRPVQEKVE